MIIWNCQKVNSSNSALKPLQRLPNVPKVSYVWDILIFQAPVTFRFTEESHGDYLQLEHIGQNWRNLMEIHTFWLSSCPTNAWGWSGPLLGDIGNHFRCLRVFRSFLGYNWVVKVSKGILGGLFWCLSSNFLKFSQVTNRPIDIFQLIWRSKIPEISKCPIYTQLLAHWEASGEVSVLSYKSFLFDSSKRSYCIFLIPLSFKWVAFLLRIELAKHVVLNQH